MATDIKKLAEELVNMTVLEVNELKTFLKDEYGIEPVAAVAAVAAGGEAAGADEGKSEYDVVLKDAGAQKIAVDRKSTRLNSSHPTTSRMPSSA